MSVGLGGHVGSRASFLIDLKAQVTGCYRMLYVFLVFKEFVSFAHLVFWNYSSHYCYKN